MKPISLQIFMLLILLVLCSCNNRGQKSPNAYQKFERKGVSEQISCACLAAPIPIDKADSMTFYTARKNKDTFRAYVYEFNESTEFLGHNLRILRLEVKTHHDQKERKFGLPFNKRPVIVKDSLNTTFYVGFIYYNRFCAVYKMYISKDPEWVDDDIIILENILNGDKYGERQ